VLFRSPDLIVFRLNSSDGRMNDKYTEAVNEASKDDKIDPRRLASGITDYRDLAARLHNDLDSLPCVMYVQDSRGISCVYALAWPYMFMGPDAKIAGLDIVASLGGGNDADIKAKMFSAWTGIAKGILELGGRPQELCDALVRPDRKLSADIDGRTTKWRSDTLGSWYVIDQSDEVSARFSSKSAEDTGLTDGVAYDMADLMYLLGYPEYTTVDSGEKIFRDTNAVWRKRYAESKKMMEEFQQEMEGPQDLGKRKQILEKMRQLFKQYPQLAKMWEWTRGLTDDQLKILIEQLGEQMERLHRVTFRTIWVNPLKVTPGYAPLARGMAAALPHVDAFVEGHSIAAMEELAATISALRLVTHPAHSAVMQNTGGAHEGTAR
jgi:hypothetical protein